MFHLVALLALTAAPLDTRTYDEPFDEVVLISDAVDDASSVEPTAIREDARASYSQRLPQSRLDRSGSVVRVKPKADSERVASRLQRLKDDTKEDTHADDRPAVERTVAPARLPTDPDPTKAVASAEASDSSPPWSEYATREDVKAEVESQLQAQVQSQVQAQVESQAGRIAWRKGKFQITPYGTLWGDMAFDTQRAKTGDYCLWIESQTLHPDDPDAAVDARSTRLGFDLAGPDIPCFCDAKIGGKVEIDFQGYYLTRNKPGLLLRHAYVEAVDEEFRLLVGQTWDVISPLGIPTLNYTAGSAVGNVGYRRAQFRAERYWAVSDTCKYTLQGSLNANVVTDFVSETTTTSADIGPYPDVQARGAITLGQRDGCCVAPTVLGIGGHYGEQDFDFRISPQDLDVERPTWSACADFYIPITSRLGFQGEFFTGENLSNYMGGILQGVDRITHQGIHSTGGWADIWFKWRPNLCSHTGYSLDDPADGDLKAPGCRTYNQMFYSNLLYDVSKNLQLGVEVDVWKTLYLDMKPGEAVRFDFAVKYTF